VSNARICCRATVGPGGATRGRRELSVARLRAATRCLPARQL